MKANPPTAIALLASAGLLSGIFAAGEGEKQAYLGVATAPVDEVVAAQLDLPEGVGAAVKIVVPESPAERAGIAKNDIVFEFDGTAVTSPQHLSDLVREKSPGDEVSVAVIQRGDKNDLTVTLGERPEHLPEVAQGDGEDAPPGIQLNLGDVGELKFDIQPLLRGGNPDELKKQMEKMRAQMQQQLKGMMDLEDLGDLPGAADVMGMASKSMMMSDGNGSIKIETKEGKTHVTAKDADGNVTFEGPANSDEDRAKIPADVREKLEKFESSNIQLDFKGFNFSEPKMRVPELKPGKEVEPEKDEIPPAEKDGKKIEI